MFGNKFKAELCVNCRGHAVGYLPLASCNMLPTFRCQSSWKPALGVVMGNRTCEGSNVECRLQLWQLFNIALGTGIS